MKKQPIPLIDFQHPFAGIRIDSGSPDARADKQRFLDFLIRNRHLVRPIIMADPTAVPWRP